MSEEIMFRPLPSHLILTTDELGAALAALRFVTSSVPREPLRIMSEGESPNACAKTMALLRRAIQHLSDKQSIDLDEAVAIRTALSMILHDFPSAVHEGICNAELPSTAPRELADLLRSVIVKLGERGAAPLALVPPSRK